MEFRISYVQVLDYWAYYCHIAGIHMGVELSEFGSSEKEKKNVRREELILNKIFAIITILIGALSVPVEWDATFFLFTLIVGGYLFFAKRNWIAL